MDTLWLILTLTLTARDAGTRERVRNLVFHIHRRLTARYVITSRLINSSNWLHLHINLRRKNVKLNLLNPPLSQDSDQLVDPSSVSVIGVVDEQGSVKFAELDNKWSEHFSHLEALKSFEPTFSSKVKVAPTHSPPHDVENMAEPFIRPSTSKLTGTGFSAEKHQPTRQAVTCQQASTTKFPGTGFSANKHQPASQTRAHRPTSTTRFTGQGSSAIVHQPTSQTKVNRPTTTTDPSAKLQSTGEGDGNRPFSDRPTATDRLVSSELADTGSPTLHRSRRNSTCRICCRITHHWIYTLKKGSYLRIRISL